MRKVLWAVSTIGTGHVHRSVRISQELNKLLGDVEIIFVSGFPAHEALMAEGVKCLEALTPVKMPVRDGYLDTMALVQDWVAKESDNAGFFYQLVNHYQPCLVVSDELPSLTAVGRSLGVPSALVTDFLFVETTNPYFGNLGFNVLLNLLGPPLVPLVRRAYEHIERVILANHISHLPGNWRQWAEQHVMEVGPIVRDIDGSVDVRQDLGLHPNQRLFVVTVGGSAAGTFLARTAIEALPEIRKCVPGALMLLVLGPSIPPEKVIRDLPAGNSDAIIVRQFVPNLLDYLAASDLAICCSGLTTLNEIALRARVPAITCPIGNHWEQIGNARQAGEAGFARVIERHNLSPSLLAREAISILTDRNLWERMVQATYTIEEAGGARRAAEILAGMVPERSPQPSPSQNNRSPVNTLAPRKHIDSERDKL